MASPPGPIADLLSAFPDLSAMPAPASARANTMFAEVPSRVWQIYVDIRAVAEHKRVMDWIDGLLFDQADRFEINHEGFQYIRPLTATEGFFKLIMRGPPPVFPLMFTITIANAYPVAFCVQGTWYLAPPEPQDLPLVFSLKDLYFLGFEHQNLWYLFQDAKLEGSGHDSEHKTEWCELPFTTRYSGNKFDKVEVSASSLTRCHETLTNYLQRVKKGRAEVANSLYCIIVVIPEAKRFPEWLLHLLTVWSTGSSTFVGKFGKLFQSWSKICKQILKGPENFKPVFCFYTYIAALTSVAVLLRDKPGPDEMEVNCEFRNPVKQYDPDYDLNDPDTSAATESEMEDDSITEESEEEEEEEDSITEESEEEEEDSITEESEEEEEDSITKESEEEEDSITEESECEDILDKEDARGREWAVKPCCFLLVFCIAFLFVWMVQAAI